MGMDEWTHHYCRRSPSTPYIYYRTQLQVLAKSVGVKANGKTADLIAGIRCVPCGVVWCGGDESVPIH